MKFFMMEKKNNDCWLMIYKLSRFANMKRGGEKEKLSKSNLEFFIG